MGGFPARESGRLDVRASRLTNRNVKPSSPVAAEERAGRIVHVFNPDDRPRFLACLVLATKGWDMRECGLRAEESHVQCGSCE